MVHPGIRQSGEGRGREKGEAQNAEKARCGAQSAQGQDGENHGACAINWQVRCEPKCARFKMRKGVTNRITVSYMRR